jgi:hypothetical protein
MNIWTNFLGTGVGDFALVTLETQQGHHAVSGIVIVVAH